MSNQINLDFNSWSEIIEKGWYYTNERNWGLEVISWYLTTPANGQNDNWWRIEYDFLETNYEIISRFDFWWRESWGWLRYRIYLNNWDFISFQIPHNQSSTNIIRISYYSWSTESNIVNWQSSSTAPLWHYKIKFVLSPNTVLVQLLDDFTNSVIIENTFTIWSNLNRIEIRRNQWFSSQRTIRVDFVYITVLWDKKPAWFLMRNF